ncbi:tail fiber protein [Pectobacterium phage PP81]|uniref:Tail spike protein n=1 Tax=Pectobacterium phage PP81 TaxID=1927014 RepID=A0A1L7DS39_9CAUD|nr:tail fiber protein [Pectobacterium phage PP81]APU03064.1 tail spike protein [Pectobacterium phage PP81]
MANVIKTVVTYNLDGSRDFAVPFEYLARKFVKVTLIGQDRRELDITTDFRFSTKTTITTTRTWGAADGYSLIEIRRFTSVSDRLVDFQDGSILRANDLNLAQIQAIHIAEEARDLTADTIAVDNDGNLDARGRRLVNLVDGVDPQDAVTVKQLRETNGSAADVLNILAGTAGFNRVYGFQTIRMDTAQARITTVFKEGQRVYLTDRGLFFKFTSARYVVGSAPEALLSVEDELHIFVDSGGMLEFDDYESLSFLEAKNYNSYLADFRTNTPIIMGAYGDSITFGLQADGSQAPNNYPKTAASVISQRTRTPFTAINRGIPSDRALTTYLRYPQGIAGTRLSTIMLGVNDVQFATGNGADWNAIKSNLYSVENFHVVMRKFVAREILRGNAVVLLGMTQYVSLNLGELGGFSTPYLAQCYEAAIRSIAKEFNVMYVNTRKDIIGNYGISESCYDGLHPKDSFQKIIGVRLAAMLLHVDYKNPLEVGAGSIASANILHSPIVSNRVLVVSEKSGFSSPLGGAENNPAATGVKIPEGETGGSITVAVYIKDDSAVVFPTINGDTAYSFDMLWDEGNKQPDFDYDGDLLLKDRQFHVSAKSISGNAPKHRLTENYSQIYGGCYFHVTSRGWHILTFNAGPNAGNVSYEGLVVTSWESVRSNDVYLGVNGLATKDASGITIEKNILVCHKQQDGQYNVTTANLNPTTYMVNVETPQDDRLLLSQVLYKTQSGFQVRFYDKDNLLSEPAEFTIKIIGGR